MKLFVTIYETNAADAVATIRDLKLPHDGVEVRAERFPSIDLQAIRAATDKPIILTYRGARVPDVDAALQAGIDFVDVEWHEGVQVAHPERTVISHHDYDGMRDVEGIMASMRAFGCAHTKLAATPQNFAENERLLALLPGSVIGMGERGLYSRILAPFLGSELVFVAGSNIAAPGQLTLERANEIYWPVRAEKVFAVVGNPAGHSLSPVIHNRLFREKNVPAAYTIASFDSFDEVKEAFLRGNPCGLSVTTPFKEEAFDFAREHEVNAIRARAVNTLVNVGGKIIADNTDVDGFRALIPDWTWKAAVIGAGPTARAAMAALEMNGVGFAVFNRTGYTPLEELRNFDDADVIINALPAGVEVEIPPCRTYIEAAYSGPRRKVSCDRYIGGLELLHAQAVRQHRLFMKVFE